MTWQEALDIVVAQTKHEKFREQCSDANHDTGPNSKENFRALMLKMAADDYGPSTVKTGGCCDGFNPYGDE